MCSKSELQIILSGIAKTARETFGEHLDSVILYGSYARGDYIMDDEGRLWFLEFNTLPGMTPTSLLPQEAQAVGMSYEDLCEKIVEMALSATDK
jgi:D-alanine-D-alanine ligase